MHQLPELPYAHDALEPHIDSRTMQIHHGKHHQAYVNNLNAALNGHDDLASKSIEDLLRGIDTVPDAIRTAVQNNGGGHANHSLFWTSLCPNGGGVPSGSLADSIAGEFGSFNEFKDQFQTAAGTRFGSGWGMVGGESGRRPERVFDSEPRQPVHAGRHADPGRRRVGARVLPQLPEPASRLPQGVLEPGRLVGDRAAVRGRLGLRHGADGRRSGPGVHRPHRLGSRDDLFTVPTRTAAVRPRRHAGRLGRPHLGFIPPHDGGPLRGAARRRCVAPDAGDTAPGRSSRNSPTHPRR